MKTSSLLRAAFTALALATLGCTPEAPAPPTPTQTPTNPPAPPSISTPSEAAGVRYLEWISGGATTHDRLPLVVAIHGLGDRPESFSRLFQNFSGQARFVFPYGDPWRGGFAWWSPRSAGLDEANIATACTTASGRLAAMMTAIAKARPTAGKPVVTGFSQGGMLSFAIAVLHPEAIAESIPVAGFLAAPLRPTAWPAGKIAPPIFALHGDADTRVPVTGARESVEALKGLGFQAGLQEYPGIGHTIGDAMREDLFRRVEAAIRREGAR